MRRLRSADVIWDRACDSWKRYTRRQWAAVVFLLVEGHEGVESTALLTEDGFELV